MRFLSKKKRKQNKIKLYNLYFFLNKMKIYFGVLTHLIEVTDICKKNLSTPSVIDAPLFIPSNDHSRTFYFHDPLFGVLKKIFIESEDGTILQISDRDHIIISKKPVTAHSFRRLSIKEGFINLCDDCDIENRLYRLYDKIQCVHGDIKQKYCEQKIALRFISPSDQVLEIGANNGLISLIIRLILNTPTQLLSLETDPTQYQQLIENRDKNQMIFHVDQTMVSERKWIQRNDYLSPYQDYLPIPNGYNKIESTSLSEIKKKHDKSFFNVFVINAKGMLYYLLLDYPDLLSEGLHTIIFKNDFILPSHQRFVYQQLMNNEFRIVYSERGNGIPDYYQVWRLDR